MWVTRIDQIPNGMKISKLSFEFDDSSALNIRHDIESSFGYGHHWVCRELYPLRMAVSMNDVGADLLKLVGKRISVVVRGLREFQKFKGQVALVKMKKNLTPFRIPGFVVGADRAISDEELMRWLDPPYPDDAVCQLYGISEVEIDERVVYGVVAGWVELPIRKIVNEVETRGGYSVPPTKPFDLDSLQVIVETNPFLGRRAVDQVQVMMEEEVAVEEGVLASENEEEVVAAAAAASASSSRRNNSTYKEGDLYKGRYPVVKGPRGGLYYINSAGKQVSIKKGRVSVDEGGGGGGELAALPPPVRKLTSAPFIIPADSIRLDNLPPLVGEEGAPKIEISKIEVPKIEVPKINLENISFMPPPPLDPIVFGPPRRK
jgi:hypothetical protein